MRYEIDERQTTKTDESRHRRLWGAIVGQTYPKDQEPPLPVEHELKREFAVITAGLVHGLLAKLKEERGYALKARRLASKIQIQRLKRRDVTS